MYQARRVADPIAQADAVAPAARAVPHTPRHAAPTLADRAFAKGSIALAVITAGATAGAVVMGSSGDPASAAGTALAVAPSTEAVAVAAAAAVAPVTSTLTAERLAAPAAGRAKVASQALVAISPMYTKASVNVRKAADVDSALLGNLELGVRVSATTDIDGKYRKVEFSDGFGWVLAAELSDAAPIEASGTTWNTCSRGSAVENRLRKDTIHIYRSVCALFPAVNSYGGWRAGGLPFHKNGRAIDIMLTPGAESALGHRIANYLIAHAKVFNVNHIIFEQHIWTPQTPHWRKMADRGSVTANHYNHVHVAINA
jgi:hypothetical protein